MSDKLVLALPSKGRLMEDTLAAFARAGVQVTRNGRSRGYRGEVEGITNIDVQFVSASEIADLLKTGAAHLGVTGEDLVREQIQDADERVTFLKPLGFGQANVVVAVPQCWIDVRRVGDLEAVGAQFHRVHGMRLRVATKYKNLTRRFLARHGVTNYRIFESLGATEGTPAAGTADIVVDITTTGETLKANGLKILDDGVILKSEANLVASKAVTWTPTAREAENEVMAKLGG